MATAAQEVGARGLYLTVITMIRWATDAEVRLDVAEWQDLGSPPSDLVARTIARWWGDRFECAANLRAFGRDQEFNMAEAQEECLTIGAVSDETVTALWEYLEDKR
jgi:hypothetical protein